MTIFLTETYACQTCFIPITNYFRAFARLWLSIPTRLICNQYISQYAPLVRSFSKLAERRTRVYPSVHENSRTGPTTQLSSTLAIQKESVEQGACVKSVYEALGSLKDHIAYCSIPGATDLLSTCGKTLGFSNIATKHTVVCHKAQKIQTSAKSVEISVNPIEPLRYFEPYTIST